MNKIMPVPHFCALCLQDFVIRVPGSFSRLEDLCMTCFHICTLEWDWVWASCQMPRGWSALQWKSGGHLSSSASPPEHNVNPCLTQKVLVLDFLQFLSGGSFVCLFCLLRQDSIQILHLDLGTPAWMQNGFCWMKDLVSLLREMFSLSKQNLYQREPLFK